MAAKKNTNNTHNTVHLESNDILRNRAQSWDLEQWRHELVKLTPKDIAQVMPAADMISDPIGWREKLAAAISGLNDRPHLEGFGSALSFNQSSEIFTYINKDPAILDKLAPIFVGMSHQIFSEILLKLTPEQLLLLKQTALTEPIQHHLTMVINNLQDELAAYELDVIAFGKKISSAPLANIDHLTINELDTEIDALIEHGLHSIKIANSALAIAWNTLRLDIIDQLSHIKESFQRLTNHNIGNHRNQEESASGLRAILESRLNSIFSDTTSNDQIKNLSDEIPAIEALVKFGIWYEQDYKDFGLLTSDTNVENIHVDMTPSERQKMREQNYLEVNANLRSLGLVTLKDLKRLQIYSRKALQEFIERSRVSP